MWLKLNSPLQYKYSDKRTSDENKWSYQIVFQFCFGEQQNSQN